MDFLQFPFIFIANLTISEIRAPMSNFDILLHISLEMGDFRRFVGGGGGVNEMGCHVQTLSR